MFDVFTRLATRRTAAVLIAAALFFVGSAAFGGPLAGLLKPSDAFVDPGSESSRANELFEDLTNGRAAPGVLLLIDTPMGARSDAGMRRIRAIARRAARDPDVARVIDVRWADETAKAARRRGEPANLPSFISKDGRKTYLAVFARPNTEEADIGGRLEQAFYGLEYVTVGGPGPGAKAIGDQVTEDLAAAEQIAFPVLFLAMLFVFRGVIAALLPLFVGGLTIVGTLVFLRIINGAVPLSIYALNLTVALGLGLAIDYSLFVVSRYREELDRGLDPKLAIRQTIHTAGKTVAFSSLTVAAALASLIVFPQQFLYSMAIAGTITALLASFITLTALTALLVALGPRVNALAPKRWQRRGADETRGFWYRWSRWVMRHAGLVTIVGSGLLLLAGTPFLRIQFTGIDTRALPKGNIAKVVDNTLRTEFADAGTEPISVVIQQVPGEDRTQVQAYADRIAQLPSVKSVSTPTSVDIFEVWQFDVNSKYETLDDRSLQLVRDIRQVRSPGISLVAGQAPRFLDEVDAIGSRLPYSIAIISLATIIILFLMTGSVLLPIKSLLMNVLAISAAFGVMVLIFQDGRFQDLLDYESQGGLEVTQPLLLLALAFGLSTDYGVFLLTRIKEGRDEGLSNDDAVAIGLQRTGQIITAAAMLFVIAIGAFATSKIIFIKEVGIGTAAAVIIDATLVRALLVPSLMKLLGEWNWWAPGPLRRLHDRLGISEAAPELPPDYQSSPATPPSSPAATPSGNEPAPYRPL
jgi:uncharacterized membrane protein YdfJ with MMPL/SSD domain